MNNINLPAITTFDSINHMAAQNAFLTCFVIIVKAVEILCWCQKFRGSFSRHTDEQSIACKAPNAPSQSNTPLRIPLSLNRQLNQCKCAIFTVRKQKTTKHNMRRRKCWFCIPRFRYIHTGECVEIYCIDNDNKKSEQI